MKRREEKRRRRRRRRLREKGGKEWEVDTESGIYSQEQIGVVRGIVVFNCEMQQYLINQNKKK